MKDYSGRYFGLKNLSEIDPEYKFSVGGMRVEVSGNLMQEEMKGPDGNKYDIVGIIEVTSIEQL